MSLSANSFNRVAANCAAVALALTTSWATAQVTGIDNSPVVAAPTETPRMPGTPTMTETPAITNTPRMPDTFSTPDPSGRNNRSSDSSMDNSTSSMGNSTSRNSSKSSSKGSMSKSGGADYDFAVNMRKHHQKALDMARTQLNSGKDSTLTRMAEDIVASQTREISELDRWLSEHNSNR